MSNDSSKLAELEASAKAAEARAFEVSLEHYTAFLSLSTSISDMENTLNDMPSSLDLLKGKTDSVLSSLEGATSSMTSISEAHASSRKSIASLPRLLTVVESPQLVELLIRTGKFAQAVSVMSHILSLKTEFEDDLVAAIQRSILEGGMVDSLIKSVTDRIRSVIAIVGNHHQVIIIVIIVVCSSSSSSSSLTLQYFTWRVLHFPPKTFPPEEIVICALCAAFVSVSFTLSLTHIQTAHIATPNFVYPSQPTSPHLNSTQLTSTQAHAPRHQRSPA